MKAIPLVLDPAIAGRKSNVPKTILTMPAATRNPEDFAPGRPKGGVWPYG
ncbi:hypothetical protein [Pseudarthrobacter sulfonivorans]|nr:hypothetical protein [Pseudarthrobacter sulfonivorans]MDR6416981.1 hypothetical protein [Pseudarthrobacter sulfonivorans]